MLFSYYSVINVDMAFLIKVEIIIYVTRLT